MPRPAPVSRSAMDQKRPASATFSRASLSRARPPLPSSANVSADSKTRKYTFYSFVVLISSHKGTPHYRLFESRKDEIYKSAASLISSLESEPYFLMSLFKKVSKMNSSYLRQKLLLVLDELVEEQEEQADEVTNKGKFTTSHFALE